MSTNIGIRECDLEKDLTYIKRIWKEVGWATEEHELAQVEHFFASGKTLVGTIDDIPECSVLTVPGTLRLQEQDLDLCAVAAVTTSRVARGHAFAQRLTALQLAQGAQDGAKVAALGMFDQGFYDKVGFGTGAYSHRFSIDPSMLKVSPRVRPPQRLTPDDYRDVYQAMVSRAKRHGSVVLHPEIMMKAELGFEPSGFGLGYREAGELTHFVWLEPQDEHGPYELRWMGYRSHAQLLELLGVLKSLGDQVYTIHLMEPSGIQLQSLLERPFRQGYRTRNSKFAVEHRSIAWWQARVLDVEACVAALSIPNAVSMNLKLHDPVAAILADEKTDWQGVGGEYVVHLGSQSSVRSGLDKDLPTLECDVGAFTRLLWGVLSASGLAVSDPFSAPAELLDQLDSALCMPAPDPGWDF